MTTASTAARLATAALTRPPASRRRSPAGAARPARRGPGGAGRGRGERRPRRRPGGGGAAGAGGGARAAGGQRPRAGRSPAVVTIAAVPLVVRVARVRRLGKAGYGREDLVDALRAELAHRREELAVLYGGGPSPLERALRPVCYGCIAVAGGIVVGLERMPGLA